MINVSECGSEIIKMTNFSYWVVKHTFPKVLFSQKNIQMPNTYYNNSGCKTSLSHKVTRCPGFKLNFNNLTMC